MKEKEILFPTTVNNIKNLKPNDKFVKPMEEKV